MTHTVYRLVCTMWLCWL